MVSVFDYTNYRKYLADFYEEKKAEAPAFSFQLIADKAGFKDKSTVYGAMIGRRNLSKTAIFKLSQALKHNRYEAEYFENLVAFNQTTELKERNYFFERMSQPKNRGRCRTASQAQLLRQDQYEFFSKWYHLVVRSLVDLYEFKNDYQALARMVNPPITRLQAKQSIRLLERLGLIAKQKNGVYAVTGKSLTTGKEVIHLAAQNFHVQCTDLAKRALYEIPHEKRNITGLTLGISDETYKRICEEIQGFQERIMEIANADENADKVYQFNFHLFPSSRLMTNH